MHMRKLINPIASDESDPAAANALQEGLGGQFGEMRTMMQYRSRASITAASSSSTRTCSRRWATEEISHVELIATTINQLLDGAPGYDGDPRAPLDTAPRVARPRWQAPCPAATSHHFLVGARGVVAGRRGGQPLVGLMRP